MGTQLFEFVGLPEGYLIVTLTSNVFNIETNYRLFNKLRLYKCVKDKLVLSFQEFQDCSLRVLQNLDYKH